MTQPTPYSRPNGTTVFTDWSTNNPSTPHQGNKLDADFNAIVTTTSQILTNLALIQRDDGAIHNDSIGRDQLKDEVMAGVNAPTTWATGRYFDARDSVIVGTIWAWALSAHTAGATFAGDASHWSTIFNVTDTLTPLILATTVPTAIGVGSSVGVSTLAARADHGHSYTPPVFDEGLNALFAETML